MDRLSLTLNDFNSLWEVPTDMYRKIVSKTRIAKILDIAKKVNVSTGHEFTNYNESLNGPRYDIKLQSFMNMREGPGGRPLEIIVDLGIHSELDTPNKAVRIVKAVIEVEVRSGPSPTTRNMDTYYEKSGQKFKNKLVLKSYYDSATKSYKMSRWTSVENKGSYGYEQISKSTADAVLIAVAAAALSSRSYDGFNKDAPPGPMRIIIRHLTTLIPSLVIESLPQLDWFLGHIDVPSKRRRPVPVAVKAPIPPPPGASGGGLWSKLKSSFGSIFG